MHKQISYMINKLDFELDRTKIKDFFTKFIDKNIKDEDRIHGKYKYMIELQKISNKKSKILTIFVEDLEEFFVKDASLFKNIVTNTKRYMKIFYDVTEEIMPLRTTQANFDEIEPIQEVIMNQRMANLSNNLSDNNTNSINDKNLSKFSNIPNELLRR